MDIYYIDLAAMMPLLARATSLRMHYGSILLQSVIQYCSDQLYYLGELANFELTMIRITVMIHN